MLFLVKNVVLGGKIKFYLYKDYKEKVWKLMKN